MSTFAQITLSAIGFYSYCYFILGADTIVPALVRYLESIF